jgi:hypothetical protein
MWKKTLLAFAAAAAILGFAAPSEAAPFDAPYMHRPRMQSGPIHVQHQPRHWGGGPRIQQHIPPGFGYDPMRRRHGDQWRHHHRHWRGGGSWGWYGGGGAYSPPGLYGGGYVYDDCRVIKKRVRVWTDYGWRFRWRTVRVCD